MSTPRTAAGRALHAGFNNRIHRVDSNGNCVWKSGTDKPCTLSGIIVTIESEAAGNTEALVAALRSSVAAFGFADHSVDAVMEAEEQARAALAAIDRRDGERT